MYILKMTDKIQYFYRYQRFSKKQKFLTTVSLGTSCNISLILNHVNLNEML